MDFDKPHGLLERGWVFEVDGLGRETRLMLHGHTFVKWSLRGGIALERRADELTSVNWRIAKKDARGNWSQDGFGNAVLPAHHVTWRRYYINRDYESVVWNWREWDCNRAEGLPSGEREEESIRKRYRRIQILLQLAAEAEVKETYSKRQTDKAVRSHGQTVEEMDITVWYLS